MVPEGPEPASTICLVLMPNLVPFGTGSRISEQRLGQRYTTAEETGTIYEEVVHFQWGASDKSTGVQDLQLPRCAKGWCFYTAWGCWTHLHSMRFSRACSVCYMQPFVQLHGSHVSQAS